VVNASILDFAVPVLPIIILSPNIEPSLIGLPSFSAKEISYATEFFAFFRIPRVIFSIAQKVGDA